MANSGASTADQSTLKHVVTSAVILIVAVVIIVGIAIGFGAVGIPLWPFILLLFYYSSFERFDSSKFVMTCVGTAIGIFVGMSQGIFTELLGNQTAGLVVFVTLVLVLGTGFIMGDVPWASIYGILTMTILTLFSQTAGAWAGNPANTDMGWVEAFSRCMASFAICVVLFVIVNALMKKKGGAEKDAPRNK